MPIDPSKVQWDSPAIDASKVQWDEPAEKRAKLNWSDVPSQALANAPKSFGNMISGIAEAVTSPLQTGKAILDLGAGALQNVLPERLVQAIGEDKASRQVANQVGQFYKDRYGSSEGLKQALATDPVGVMADASTVLTGGSTVAPKLATAARAVDPVVLALRAGGKTAEALGNVGGKVAKNVLGTTTGAGSEALSQAYQAGKSGGQAGESFLSNMRGNAPMTDVLDTAKANLQELRMQRGQQYRSGMVDIAKDKAVIDFKPIDNAISSLQQMGSFKGQVINKNAAGTVDEVSSLVNQWKSLDPAEYHTPEGLDALKKAIGDIRDATQFGTPGRRAADTAYNAVKTQIDMQAPTYAKVMKDYSQASETLTEIEKALSLGKKAAADTSMRKLQSLMRNNVNTNYGNRLELARALEQQGGNQIMPQLAGQALNDWTPRGIQRAGAGTGGAIMAMTGNIPGAIGTAALSSPRLAGEAAYGAGALARALRNRPQVNMPVDPRILGNAAYQAGNLSAVGQQ